MEDREPLLGDVVDERSRKYVFEAQTKYHEVHQELVLCGERNRSLNEELVILKAEMNARPPSPEVEHELDRVRSKLASSEAVVLKYANWTVRLTREVESAKNAVEISYSNVCSSKRKRK
jgi:hypothetical protein